MTEKELLERIEALEAGDRLKQAENANIAGVRDREPTGRAGDVWRATEAARHERERVHDEWVRRCEAQAKRDAPKLEKLKRQRDQAIERILAKDARHAADVAPDRAEVQALDAKIADVQRLPEPMAPDYTHANELMAEADMVVGARLTTPVLPPSQVDTTKLGGGWTRPVPAAR